jgi:signal transduction histidine kinase
VRQKTLEPGLLDIFRWLVGARLVFLLLGFAGTLLPFEPRTLRYPLFGILESVFLLGYLSWPWLCDRLGTVYLPVALLVASCGPIVAQAVTVALRLRQGVPAASATQDVWQLILVLFGPLILVSWQYNLISVAVYCVSTALLDLVLYLILAYAGGIRYAGVLGLVFVRSLLFALVGFVVVRLVRAQREQRQALARANAQLAHYATTLEQLATSRERNRLARELHDTLAHTLSGVAVQLEAARALWAGDPEGAQDMVTRSLAATRDGLREARRAIQSLRASPLQDLGLALAVRTLATSTAERAGLSLSLQVSDEVGDLTPVVEQGVYRIAGEALENAARHAAASQVTVRLARAGGRLMLTVADDGCGFDATEPVEEDRYGLRGMRERAGMMGGALDIESQPGTGTTVRLTVEVGT